MASSGTVAPGDAVLASQYNNLRSDVIDSSSGHTHTGATDEGKQLGDSAFPNDTLTGRIMGSAVMIFPSRQGGTATDWNLQGTTNYDVTYLRVLGGVRRWTGISAPSGSISVTFPSAFNNIPIVFATALTGSGLKRIACSIDAIAAGSATIGWHVVDGSSQATVDIQWCAYGPRALT